MILFNLDEDQEAGLIGPRQKQLKLNQSLWNAAMVGDFDLLKSSIELGASVNFIGLQGKLPSIIALQNGHMDIYKYLFSKEKPDMKNTQILFINSIKYGDIEAVKYHIDQGADVNDGVVFKPIQFNKNIVFSTIEESTQNNPIMLSIQKRREDIFELLIEHGAKFSWGEVFEASLKYQFFDLTKRALDVLRSDRSIKNLIHIAVKNNSHDLLDYCISEKMPFNEIDEDGNTPLHIEAMVGHTYMYKKLVQNGCDINATNKNGTTAFQKAILRKRILQTQILRPDDYKVWYESIREKSEQIKYVSRLIKYLKFQKRVENKVIFEAE